MVIGEKTGYINHSGQIVIEPLFDYGGDFSAGLAAIAQDEKLFYIDAAGNIEIDIPDLTQAGDFVEGLAAISVGDQYGYIDLQGNFVTPPQFTYAGNFKDGLAAQGASTRIGDGYAAHQRQPEQGPGCGHYATLQLGQGRAWRCQPC